MTEAWVQILTILATNTALFLWARSEARHDQQELREGMRKGQEELRESMRKGQEETRQIIYAIHEELKDFHGRLCAIEERRIKNG